MSDNARWLLPDGVEEVLPNDALELEMLRRCLLDSLMEQGFQLVMPPIMEFADALLTGTASDLNTQTYKFMDQHTQKTLGIRADTTPQIARIDAHYLSENEINRLCYASTVLRTRPEQLGEQRELLQLGAEIFGVADTKADIEIIDAMLSSLTLSGLTNLTISLGHADIYRSLLEEHNVPQAREKQLFDVLLRQSLPDMQQLTPLLKTPVFYQLMQLKGGDETIQEANKKLPNTDKIIWALKQIQQVVDYLKQHYPQLNLHIDLSDVYGYRYHTGLKFSAHIDGHGRAVAKGGRYDCVGEQFGKSRPATGFSTDLKALIKLIRANKK